MNEKMIEEIVKEYGRIVQDFNNAKDPLEKAGCYAMKVGAERVLSSILKVEEKIENEGTMEERVTEARVTVIM